MLARAIRLSGPDSRPTAAARVDLAQQLEKMDRWPEARPLREAVFEASRHHLGDEHLDTLTAEWRFAINLVKQQMINQAKPLVVHVHDGVRSVLGPDDERTINAEKLLSRIDALTGRE